ncbi:protein BTG1-like [Pygocentrus nattereri]|uniref:Anti-proliferative protein domain-containing protein n=1 Tax=Pygocentrus nattereri TaxID=42514 RepID=A0A3B4DZY0_PYGNA|nr:protein BTG1-like [Pygocentrus nattereri]XP_017568180.1 protein BTG1-like [Pygocentrus nattereri]XP_017568181.1 protein BTG1-like [Pygocentrus nattereri]XP_017568182.1 protein BTG1-like [Pygocentrus nattereri]
MKTEISTAANFVTSLLRTAGLLTEEQLQHFSLSLEGALLGHYQHHWFPQAPCRGSGYRCLRINHKMDPLIGRAACAIGLSREQLFALLPRELTLWVDPYEVSYRIGEDGSTCVLYESSVSQPRTASSTDKGPSCKGALRTGQSSPSKQFKMMTASG